MSDDRKRLDHLLVKQGLVSSISAAQARVLAGEVYIDGERVDKPGEKYRSESNLEIRPNRGKYVSRGGFKLAGALEAFGTTVDGKVAMDIGSSTGGFTDCLLQHGASKVFCIDVGAGQLDWSLRQDPRTIVMEKVNARYLSEEMLGEKTDIIVIDVSFISLEKIIPVAKTLLNEGGVMLPMVKPQFETGKENVPRGGVIQEKKIHEQVLQRICQHAVSNELGISGIVASSILGPKGNKEFFLDLSSGESGLNESEINSIIRQVVYE